MSPVWTEPKRWTRALPSRAIPLAGARACPRHSPYRRSWRCSAWWIARRAARTARPGPPGAASRDPAAPGHGRPLERTLGRRSHGRSRVTGPSRRTSALRLKSEPETIRIFGIGDKHSGEPGYASERVDFMAVRDPLDWSLPLAWHLNASRGNTPMISRRLSTLVSDASGNIRFDLEGDSHIVTGRSASQEIRSLRSVPVGAAFIHRNSNALPAGPAGRQADLCG